MFTALAIAFLVLVVGAIVYGFGIVMRRPPTHEELTSETCLLCQRKFQKDELVERTVGDSRLFFFCGECIEKLRTDAARRDGTALRQIPK
jgi:hypothetical protein